MDLAPDFFTYFEALAPVLDRDAMLICVSSWNDHGQVSLLCPTCPPAALLHNLRDIQRRLPVSVSPREQDGVRG